MLLAIGLPGAQRCAARTAILKMTTIAILATVIAIVLYILIATLSWAEDSTALHSKGSKDQEIFTSWIGDQRWQATSLPNEPHVGELNYDFRPPSMQHSFW